MKWYDVLLNYLMQPSTYKGIFTIICAFGVTISDGLTQAIIAFCIALAGLVDVVIDEKLKNDN